MSTIRSDQVVLYEQPVPRVARIVLNRPEARNAQNVQLLYDLNQQIDRAAQDDLVSVIVLAANGPHFSSGHDLKEGYSPRAVASLVENGPVGSWCGFSCGGAEGQMAMEKEIYIGLSERWRNVPKPMIAEVQGQVIAGGLMLVWPCDIIVASEDATFADNTVMMGVSGAEFFNHPWEMGVRKAKEMLFTADRLSASDAYRLGMVNHVVPQKTLTEFTLKLAGRIAQMPLFALKLAKEAVNTAQDSQGRQCAMQTAFALHQLCHSHNQQLHGLPIDPEFFRSPYGRILARGGDPGEPD
jgi:enoyl-CoA hydratase